MTIVRFIVSICKKMCVIFVGVAKAAPIQFNLFRCWLLVVTSSCSKIAQTLVKSWSRVGQAGQTLVKSWSKVGQKLVKLVKSCSNFDQFCQVGQKLVKNSPTWSSWFKKKCQVGQKLVKLVKN